MSNCGSEAYSPVLREAHNWVCLVRAADEARNGHTGAAVDGPRSLLNYQGHPVERLTPDRHVTIPSANTGRIVPEKSISRTIFGLGAVADS